MITNTTKVHAILRWRDQEYYLENVHEEELFNRHPLHFERAFPVYEVNGGLLHNSYPRTIFVYGDFMLEYINEKTIEYKEVNIIG